MPSVSSSTAAAAFLIASSRGVIVGTSPVSRTQQLQAPGRSRMPSVQKPLGQPRTRSLAASNSRLPLPSCDGGAQDADGEQNAVGPVAGHVRAEGPHRCLVVTPKDP